MMKEDMQILYILVRGEDKNINNNSKDEGTNKRGEDDDNEVNLDYVEDKVIEDFVYISEIGVLRSDAPRHRGDD